MSIFPYKKILVVGPGGAGKSTFSKKLSKVLNIPVYHLDSIYWLPNWEHLEREEFIEKVRVITSKDETRRYIRNYLKIILVVSTHHTDIGLCR